MKLTFGQSLLVGIEASVFILGLIGTFYFHNENFITGTSVGMALIAAIGTGMMYAS